MTALVVGSIVVVALLTTGTIVLNTIAAAAQRAAKYPRWEDDDGDEDTDR